MNNQRHGQGIYVHSKIKGYAFDIDVREDGEKMDDEWIEEYRYVG